MRGGEGGEGEVEGVEGEEREEVEGEEREREGGGMFILYRKKHAIKLLKGKGSVRVRKRGREGGRRGEGGIYMYTSCMTAVVLISRRVCVSRPALKAQVM